MLGLKVSRFLSNGRAHNTFFFSYELIRLVKSIISSLFTSIFPLFLKFYGLLVYFQVYSINFMQIEMQSCILWIKVICQMLSLYSVPSKPDHST